MQEAIQETIQKAIQKAIQQALEAQSANMEMINREAQNANKEVINSINSIKGLIEPHMAPLQAQNKQLVKLTAGIATELKQQANIITEHTTHQTAYHEKASDLQNKLMEEQKKITSSSARSNQILASINNNTQHLPQLSSELLPQLLRKINASTQKMLKDTADSLETTFDHQLKSNLHEHHQAVEDTIKTEQKTLEETIKIEQKANKRLLLRLFRTLHKLFRMILRKGQS